MSVRRKLLAYATPNDTVALWQAISTLGLFVALVTVSFYLANIHPLLSLLLSIPTGLVVVRLFILQHDCGHGGFSKSKLANACIGRICAFVALTPYSYWNSNHHTHHQEHGKLDGHRYDGEVWMLTVAEYKNAPRWKRWLYRAYRSRSILFVIGPILYFIVMLRLPQYGRDLKEKRSIWFTNIALGLTLLIAHGTIGVIPFLCIYLPVAIVAGMIGVWAFFVQHSYKNAYWEHAAEWNGEKASILGSSFLDLPKILRWCTADIGYHPLHHLLPRIPNYKLRACWDANKELFVQSPRITFLSSFREMKNALWDEEQKCMITFREFKTAT